MRVVVQRALSGSVEVAGEIVGAIGPGLVVLLGISPSDSPAEAAWAVDKICNLRIFPDASEKMERSLLDIGGEVLLVSQFTLYGDARKGRRPSFIKAASGPEAEALYDEVAAGLRRMGVTCATGRFGAMMDVTLVNNGPVTILLDSEKTF